ncbi:aromatic acid exporter family protein [Salinibacterium sp. GXW1014]|uniref:FUSC family protein n=1 Tax=Salinibacterium sp. GXW1014 TaxID=3377838 RepID=UPI00383BBB84
MAESGSARRLERRLNRSLDARAALGRVAESAPNIAQIVLAAMLAWLIAHEVLGHPTPAIALVSTLTILGFNRDARPRRVLESAVGILVGIVLSEVALLVVGSGWWQIATVLTVTLFVARLLSPSAPFAIAAGVQSILVMVLPAPDGGVFTRSIDGLVGGLVALAVTALLPRDPRRIARRDAQRLLATLSESLSSVVEALRDGQEPAASLALSRLRRTQALIDAWAQSQESAIAIARISPFLRRHLPALRRQSQVLAGLDLAARHLRVISRRIAFLVRDGEQRPALAGLVQQVADAVTLLGESLDDPAAAERARGVLVDVMPMLDPSNSLPGARMPTTIVVHLLRPLVVDLLVATGMRPEEARTLLPSS